MTRLNEEFVQSLHLEAMEFCDKALAARRKGRHAHAKRLFKKAFERENEAAKALELRLDLEPVRSVLFRSAASLAIECGEQRSAEQLIGLGLAGNPPNEIADELRDLFEQVNLERHLGLRGLELAPAEFQLSLEGNATGFGMAESAQVMGRVDVSSRMIIRTIERKLAIPFRESRPPNKEITENVELYLSVPRAASFAITIRLGVPQHEMQLRMPFMANDILYNPREVIDDVFACLESLNSDEGNLDDLIPDEIYRRNFQALARRLAPDGDRIKTVGLTVTRDGDERRVALRKSIPGSKSKVRRKEQIRLTGWLKIANEHSERNTISIVDSDNHAHKVMVPAGMMADIVKPHWGALVVVTARTTGKLPILEQIDPVLG